MCSGDRVAAGQTVSDTDDLVTVVRELSSVHHQLPGKVRELGHRHVLWEVRCWWHCREGVWHRCRPGAGAVPTLVHFYAAIELD